MAIAYFDPKPRTPFCNRKKPPKAAALFRFQWVAGTNRVWTRAVAMALLDFAEFEALMASILELIFYTALLTFWAKCWKFADKFVRYFCNAFEK
ncbi:hypothetical protein [Shewanella algae]|uniref:hypothetical protein n=1 Tax=Shewanella algae TaxID=38313 RepID=UPI001182FC59|nr:hypothetical protein [Shewanella algae]